MGHRFMYDCVVIKEEDGYCASFPQIPGAVADGNTREEALQAAEEVLRLFVAEYVNEGKPAPRYERSAEVVALSTELSRDEAMETACVTFAQAAEELSVSPSRLTALVQAGTLEVWLVAGRRMITIESVERYRTSGRKAGRPKKHAIAAAF